jgi:uncharacterized protein (TIGR02996 family)
MDSPSWHLFGDDYGGKMSGAEGFLSGIRAEPDDDAPRLVFADWLEDQGDAERAEFIRVQCELARPNLETGPPAASSGGSANSCKSTVCDGQGI